MRGKLFCFFSSRPQREECYWFSHRLTGGGEAGRGLSAGIENRKGRPSLGVAGSPCDWFETAKPRLHQNDIESANLNPGTFPSDAPGWMWGAVSTVYLHVLQSPHSAMTFCAAFLTVHASSVPSALRFESRPFSLASHWNLINFPSAITGEFDASRISITRGGEESLSQSEVLPLLLLLKKKSPLI